MQTNGPETSALTYRPQTTTSHRHADSVHVMIFITSTTILGVAENEPNCRNLEALRRLFSVTRSVLPRLELRLNVHHIMGLI
jgi:hypothetical protein